MRVLAISPVTWPTRGGLSTVVHSLQEAAERVGDTWILIRPVGSISEEGPDPYALSICMPKSSEVDGIFARLRAVLLRFRAIVVLRRIVKQHDINLIHVHFPMHFLWPTAFIGVPTVITFHGSDVERFIEKKPSLGLSRLVHHARRLITVSSFLRHEIVGVFPGLNEKIIVIHNGRGPVVTEEPMPRRESNGQFNLLFVGDLLPVKGADILPAALRRLDQHVDFNITLIGDGELRNVIEPTIVGLLRDGHCHFLGEVAPEVVRHEMRRADVLILPSRREGLGNVILEAMEHGCVVVASRVGGIPEIVKDGETGILVNAADAASLAEGLLKVYESEELRNTIRRKAAQFINNFPDWDETYAQYKHIYMMESRTRKT